MLHSISEKSRMKNNFTSLCFVLGAFDWFCMIYCGRQTLTSAMIDQCIQNVDYKNILSPSNSSKYTSNQAEPIQHVQVGQTWTSWPTFDSTLLEQHLQASQFTNTPIFLLPLQIYRVWLAPSLTIWTEWESGLPCGSNLRHPCGGTVL